jgi:glycerophosphoryl diester phosphodiesterase
VLVVTHDPVINDVICAGAGRLPSRVLGELTWRQIATLDCGTRKNPRFPRQVPVPGQRIPRLEQVLELLRAHPRLGANVEIKTSPERRRLTHPPARFAAALVPLLRKRRLEGRVVIQSFDPAALTAVARLDPDRKLTLAALADRRAEIAPMLRATRATIISPRYTEIGAEEVRSLQRRGLRVIPWTVNRVDAMRRLMAWGVDGIITDRPDLLLELAGRRRR